MNERGSVVLTVPLAVCALSGVLCWLLVTSQINPASVFAFIAAIVAVSAITVTTAVAAYVLAGRSLGRTATTPFALAAATWIVLFVVRPLELYVWPDHAATSIAQMGFGLGDLTRGVALAGVGCAAFCVAYLLVLRRSRGTELQTPSRAFPVSGRRASVALAFGTLLWMLLFLRQGGVSTLISSPAAIRVNQGGSSYAFIGVWIVQGTALYALASVLTGGGRTAKRVLWASVGLACLAAAALQLRGLVAVAVLAAGTIYLLLRGVTRRAAAIVLAAVVVGGVGFVAAQQVRAYSTVVSGEEAIRLTTRTPLHLMLISDLSTYENLVAIDMLVPESIGYLNGETLIAIPQALVPRAIWPDKPESVDVRVGSYLYPGVGVGIPITMQGELFWNGGLLVVLLGAFAIGAAFGALARVGLQVRVGAALILYAAVFPFTHAALTRSLASATQNILFVILGVGFAILVIDRRRSAALLARLRGASAPAVVRRVRLGGGS